MSAAMAGGGLDATGMMPVSRRVRGYFAPVDRSSGRPTLFDPARDGAFALDAPPAPWIDLGWCEGFNRTSETLAKPLSAGAPAAAQTQTRPAVGATVDVLFLSWGKLQMALCAGSEQINLLAPAQDSTAGASGGAAAAASALGTGSTANSLVIAGEGQFAAGDLLVVDMDYAGQTGFPGSGVSGAYVGGAGTVNDVDFVRRISLNVSRVSAVQGAELSLEGALPAGAPVADMRVSRVVGFCDREGGQFFQEWSALFCLDGEQGDRVLFHYPRLQARGGAAEMHEALPGGLERVKLQGSFRALPITDQLDGAKVVCFRSYLPSTELR